MTDREMLELAARAASIKGEVINAEGLGAWIPMPGASSAVWNPLDDDGDALRLAVKLNIPVSPESANGTTWICRGSIQISESHGSDPYAATRRAIVRAAAEIGRQKETSND